MVREVRSPDQLLDQASFFLHRAPAKMPETHIAEWAQREGVYIEPAYATEVREYGVRALGSGIPGVARERLHAVPVDQWMRDKDQFIYESWISRAKAMVAQRESR